MKFISGKKTPSSRLDNVATSSHHFESASKSIKSDVKNISPQKKTKMVHLKIIPFFKGKSSSIHLCITLGFCLKPMRRLPESLPRRTTSKSLVVANKLDVV